MIRKDERLVFTDRSIRSVDSYLSEISPYKPLTTNDEYRQKYKALCEEGLERALVVRDKGYIQTDPHITAMVPLIGLDRHTGDLHRKTGRCKCRA